MVGYLFAVVDTIRWLFVIPAAPVLAVVVITLCVLVIYGLARYGDQLRGCADRDTMTLNGKRTRDARSSGEFSKLPDEGGCPCPRSHLTSSSRSGNSFRPCYRRGRPTIR
jgi:hypothetical protein